MATVQSLLKKNPNIVNLLFCHDRNHKDTAAIDLLVFKTCQDRLGFINNAFIMNIYHNKGHVRKYVFAKVQAGFLVRVARDRYIITPKGQQHMDTWITSINKRLKRMENFLINPNDFI